MSKTCKLSQLTLLSTLLFFCNKNRFYKNGLRLIKILQEFLQKMAKNRRIIPYKEHFFVKNIQNVTAYSTKYTPFFVIRTVFIRKG